MKDRILSLLGGFILSLVIILIAVYFFSKPDKTEIPTVVPIDPAKFQTVKNETMLLENNSNIQEGSASEAGRSNPFDDYE